MFTVFLKCVLYIVIPVFLVTCTDSFNLSPKANIKIVDPEMPTELPKYRSSYFGFSLVLRRHGIFIGAPRAQSMLEGQQAINETGAIYKCSLETQQCKPFVFDDIGNTMVENSEYTYDSQKKDNQWLGASMDGGPRENDRLVVCAPRRVTNLRKDYLVHGICFSTNSTTGDRPVFYKKISPLRQKGNQVIQINEKQYLYHTFGEQGISVHLTENNEEIIIGAPGISTWKGSVVRYRLKVNEDIQGFNLPDTEVKTSQGQTIEEIKADIPNPNTWAQADDSYFGYAVSSGFFEGQDSKQILYIATAPQANSHKGEAYLFDLIRTEYGDMSIQKYHVFRGSQFGEYFGYSLLTEDLNGDNLTDVIISAPLYSTGLNYDNGAVYIFLNKGHLKFESGTLLFINNGKPGRFGTALSKLGDINHDGFNDIAISAPFENDGVVYIYLGSEIGLRDKPSQILKPPSISTQYKPYMFGHGLSKGADSDGNGFNDLAIGAPNAEAVFIYKAYPVVKIIATIKTESKILGVDQKNLILEFCHRLETTSTRIMSQMVSFRLSADLKIKRVKFRCGRNEFHFNETVTKHTLCRTMDTNIHISFADIYKPIEFKIDYKVFSPNTEGFCETCAVVDPNDPVSISERVVFNTGCKSDICVTDLRLKSNGIKTSYVIGSKKQITINYEISNEGENAYLPQIKVMSSNKMPFGKIPLGCKNINDTILVCDLKQGFPLEKGEKVNFDVTFETTNAKANFSDIIAKVSCLGYESNPADDEVIDEVELEEFSVVESIGFQTSPLSIEHNLGIKKIQNKFKIRNIGPSRVKEMDILLLIPISYNDLILIDYSHISVEATYKGNPINVSFYQNNIILVQNHIYRKRRMLETASNALAHFNMLMGTNAVDKYILFDCHHSPKSSCIHAKLSLENFVPGDDSISIILKYNIDLNQVNKVLVRLKQFFIMTTTLDVSRVGDKNGSTISLQKNDACNIISKYPPRNIPIWGHVIAVPIAFLLLALTIYGLHKIGFFRRPKQEELRRFRNCRIQRPIQNKRQNKNNRSPRENANQFTCNNRRRIYPSDDYLEGYESFIS